MPTPLSAEDLTFWYADQPRQRTTMALLMLLDRRPDPARLRAAAERAVAAVPRLRQCVVDAPFDIALPRWETDPTFDLDYHLRRYAQAAPEPGESELDGLFAAVGPIYERPFDRSRPLWEMIEIDRPGDRSALFFRLHHAVADGVGGNAVLAALTDAEREGVLLPPSARKPPGAWPEAHFARQLGDALRRRVVEDARRWRQLAGALWGNTLHPSRWVDVARVVSLGLDDARFRSGSPLTRFGRSRHLSGVELDFEPLRAAKRRLGGKMIDLLLTGVAGAMGRWHRACGHEHVEELATLVPINLRPPAEQGLEAAVGNRATGITVRLPIAIDDPVARFREIHRRVEARKVHPAADALPATAEYLSSVPRWLYRAFAPAASASIELIVTNVPGLPVTRYLAGAAIEAAYPIAPTAPHTPVSIALYGYRGRLFIGLDADGTAMPDLAPFRDMLRAAFDELLAAAAQA